jgi:hypothetical protein
MAPTGVVSPGLHPGGIGKLPCDQPMAKQEPEAVVMQVFPPAANGAEQVTHLTYSPPGASCLPTPLTRVPVRIDAQ